MSSFSKKSNFTFAAINPYAESNIISPKETKYTSREYIDWGDGNAYPEYLQALHDNVPTLKSIIEGCVDYVCGDDITILPLGDNGLNKMNAKGDTIMEQVRDISGDFFQTGGYALQVIRNGFGDPVETYFIDMRFLRSNKENTVFYYSENWSKGGSKKDVIVYPAFMPNLDWNALSDEERSRHASSILYVKKSHKNTYPIPCYAAAVKACEIERCVDDFHLNAINNGFTGSYIINFNNGVPRDEEKEAIEEAFNEKFSGHENAGRIGFSWNPNKESATTIEKVDVEDFGEKYKSLEANSRQKIFTAFRANPNLFGIPTESLGFSQEEYESAFRLFNRTMIRPVQKMIADSYDKIYGQTGVITIKPFSLDETTEQEVK